MPPWVLRMRNSGAPSAAGSQPISDRVHEQADFPVAGVITERDRGAIGRADAAVGAEDEELGSAERGGVPAHSSILAPAEQVAGGPLEKHLRGEGQRAARAGRFAADLVERRVSGIEKLRDGDGHDGESDRIPIRTDCGGRRNWAGHLAGREREQRPGMIENMVAAADSWFFDVKWKSWSWRPRDDVRPPTGIARKDTRSPNQCAQLDVRIGQIGRAHV